MTKVVAIVGATGGQGGSVLNALAGRTEYHIRAITRNADSAKAKDLKERNIEVVQADANDEASLDKAFEGASVIFGVSDFWEAFPSRGPDEAAAIETTHGLNIARAASRSSTLEHFIWSTLPNARVITDGRHIVPHFESKSRVDEFIREDKALHTKTTYLIVGFYGSNFVNYPMFAPSKLESSNKYVLIQPIGGTVPLHVAGDHNTNVGLAVSRILERPEISLPSPKTGNSKLVYLVTEVLTMENILKMWGRINQKETAYLKVSVDKYDELWPKWGLEMGLMMQFFEEIATKGLSVGPGEEVVTMQDLGVEGLVGQEEVFKKLIGQSAPSS